MEDGKKNSAVIARFTAGEQIASKCPLIIHENASQWPRVEIQVYLQQ